jgi:hypothetical protein
VLKTGQAQRLYATLAYNLPLWTAVTAYLIGDVVLNGTKIYKRNANGTSGATFDVTEQAAWTIIGGGTANIQAWSAATIYKTGDMVIIPSTGSIAKSLSDRTSGASYDATEAANWSCIASILDTWTTATVFTVGDQVIFNNRIYQTTTAHLSSDFLTDDANWQISTKAMNAWVALTGYKAGDVTYNAGSLYVRIADGTSGATFDATEATAWTKLGSSVYSAPFNNTTDWGTASGGYYTITKLAAVHLLGTSINHVSIYELSGTDYILLNVDRVLVNASGDVSISVPDGPDGRFAGKVVIS